MWHLKRGEGRDGRQRRGARVKKREKTGTRKTDRSLSRHEPESDNLDNLSVKAYKQTKSNTKKKKQEKGYKRGKKMIKDKENWERGSWRKYKRSSRNRSELQLFDVSNSSEFIRAVLYECIYVRLSSLKPRSHKLSAVRSCNLSPWTETRTNSSVWWSHFLHLWGHLHCHWLLKLVKYWP